MAGRYHLAVPLACSIAFHAALFGVLELSGIGAPVVPAAVSETLPVEFRPPAAQPAPSPEPALSPASPLSGDAAAVEVIPLDTDDPLYHAYFSEVRKKIWDAWTVPAGEGPRTGTLRLEFVIDRTGALIESTVTSSAGAGDLDRAAVEAVGASAPFPPFPATIDRERLRIRALFVYE